VIVLVTAYAANAVVASALMGEASAQTGSASLFEYETLDALGVVQYHAP
jgi:hypothetical protein